MPTCDCPAHRSLAAKVSHLVHEVEARVEATPVLTADTAPALTADAPAAVTATTETAPPAPTVEAPAT